MPVMDWQYPQNRTPKKCEYEQYPLYRTPKVLAASAVFIKTWNNVNTRSTSMSSFPNPNSDHQEKNIGIRWRARSSYKPAIFTDGGFLVDRWKCFGRGGLSRNLTDAMTAIGVFVYYYRKLFCRQIGSGCCSCMIRVFVFRFYACSSFFAIDARCALRWTRPTYC